MKSINFYKIFLQGKKQNIKDIAKVNDSMMFISEIQNSNINENENEQKSQGKDKDSEYFILFYHGILLQI